MISVQTYPPLVAFAADPVNFKVLTDEFCTSVGTKAVFWASCIHTPWPEDLIIRITFFGKTLEFVAKNTPDDSGFQFQIKATGEDQGIEFANCLSSNIEIMNIFSISTENAGWTFKGTALQEGNIPDLNIEDSSESGDYYLNGSFGISEGSDKVFRSNFRLNFSVKTPDLLKRFSPRYVYPDLNSEAYIDISPEVQQLPISSFSWPQEGDVFLRVLPGYCKAYILSLWESWDIPPVNRKMLHEETRYCIPAQSSWIKQAFNNLDGTSFWEDLLMNDQFLTFQPNYKRIGYNTPEKLYFLTHTNTNLTLKVDVYFDDQSLISLQPQTIAVNKYDLVEIDFSAEMLQLSGYESGRKVTYLDVYLVTEGGAMYSEKRRFIIDREVYTKQRFFIIKNSLGTFDFLRATGYAKVFTKLDKTLTRTALKPGFTNRDREINQVSQNETVEVELNWGFLSSFGDQVLWKNYFRAMELSKEAYEIINNELIPIVFVTESVELDDETDLIEHVTRYQRAYVDDATSDNVVLGDFNNDFNNDFNI